jgi:DNA-binding IclR family transcriptional regulator
MAILRVLENEAAGLSLSGIAERVDLPRSTVQRIVAALSEEKLVMRASTTALLVLGPELARLARFANTGVEKITRSPV